jgi:hypothetical protein
MLCALTSDLLAQRTPKLMRKRPVEESVEQVLELRSPRLINSDEGLAIIGAALEVRYSRQGSGDCSHLVHDIYKQAGFPYRYADSFQLYDGIESFRQVASPQPGDLAVWRGHAAVMINPVQHSFFGSTRSGLRVESYDLKYWRRRGPPRFFRYVKSDSPSSSMVNRTATTRPPTLRNVESRAVESDTPLTPNEDLDGLPNHYPAPSMPSAVSGSSGMLLVHSPEPNPTQVAETLSRTFEETDKAIQDQDVLKFAEALIVFDHLEVASVHLKGNRGWADVKFDGISSILSGHASAKKRSEQQRWSLNRRDANAWELLPPAKATYATTDLAVRILAHHLASLVDRTSEASDSSKDRAQLARSLSLLLKK